MQRPRPNKLHDDLDAFLDGRPVELTDELVPLVEAADALRGELGAYQLDPEVAAIVGKTTGAVKSLQFRGLASLARVLGLRSPEQPPDRPYPSTDPDRLTSQEEEER